MRPAVLAPRAAALVLALALGVWLAPAPATAADRVDVAWRTPGGADEPVAQLAERINRYREQQGLGPLAWSDDLAALAGEHSQGMAGAGRLSHDGFRQRLGRSGSRLCVENVAQGFPSAETLLDGWRRSPGHHRNLVEPQVVRMGLAATARYVTFLACR